jgi:hypothetical protein
MPLICITDKFIHGAGSILIADTGSHDEDIIPYLWKQSFIAVTTKLTIRP